MNIYFHFCRQYNKRRFTPPSPRSRPRISAMDRTLQRRRSFRLRNNDTQPEEAEALGLAPAFRMRRAATFNIFEGIQLPNGALMM